MSDVRWLLVDSSFRISAFYAFKIIPDILQIGSFIVARMKKDRVEKNFFFGKVKLTETDRGMRQSGNMVKTCLEFIHFFAGAFWGDDQVKAFFPLKSLYGSGDKIVVFAAVYGDAAVGTHEPT